ncbi:invasion associated locus B family protein [Chenggangzhangella methanolivorans]|uniref:Invasion associated locus B family protein n=1 Tax=Chenggangzhangella methanolivorans TaxID=1437009 RepID=A0A9E6UPL9_9HYPH|nr:invasion associated locus B family protein [Chenggangzhangella methanolivorans]QZN99899.1 invasion associated locus B family protein [Chenggangzhangella methanolivorans]
MKRTGLSAAVLILMLGSAAEAATQKNLGRFESWSVWTYDDGERKGCFIYANPSAAFPRAADHGLVSFFVRSTTREDVRSEASLQFGYDQSAKAEGRAVIGGENFQLLTEGKAAWLSRPREDELLAAMRSGAKMTVSTVSKRGSQTRYEFSLKGVSDAMRVLRRHCP